MIFLNRNGYPAERDRAATIFQEGERYILNATEVGRSSSSYRFEGIEGSFNSVMFDFADPEKIARENDDEKDQRKKAYNASQTYTYWPRAAQPEYEVPMRTMVRTENGWEEAGDEPVTELERFRQALEDIADPLAALRRDAEAQGRQLSGAAYSIANDPHHLKEIARRALKG